MDRAGDQGGTFDVAVIGAGVVGCAVARRFALEGARVLVIEKGADILSGASKANSAILHTGFDAPPDSLELELVKAGRREYLEIHEAFNLPLVMTGAYVCAWTEAEAAKLAAIEQTGRTNGIENLCLMSGEEVLARNPTLSPRVRAALFVEDEHVIDPWSAPLAYIRQAIMLGARLVRNAEVLSGSFDGEWTLRTTKDDFRASAIINAAGLFGDIVSERLGLAADFTIRPRKGQFIVLDKAAAPLVPGIILPVPTEVTKGIVVCPTAFGNVLVGPTAEEQDDRNRATVDGDILKSLRQKAGEIVPALASMPVTAVYAGLRPATEKKHYRVSCDPDRRVITLGGIRSTGLSAALGLGQHAYSLFSGFNGTPFAKPDDVPVFAMPNLAETRERDWQKPDHGEILCHCELVTRREVEAALEGDLPAGDFGGLRRRTRAGMGRCQGFHCNAHLAALSEGKLAVPLAVSGKGERP